MLPSFKNKKLLTLALTHRSALNEKSSGTTAVQSNERLEFLGDAVLELATTDYLYSKLPKDDEGILTAYRSALVKTTTLAELARDINLGEKLFMSKGEEATGGRDNDSLLADATEAIIGALYLDQGFEAVVKFLKKRLFVKFDKIKNDKSYKDSKSLLQELVQSQGHATPIYELVKANGPDHDKEFEMQVLVDGKPMGIGAGKSKQLAQQSAAEKALSKF